MKRRQGGKTQKRISQVLGGPYRGSATEASLAGIDSALKMFKAAAVCVCLDVSANRPNARSTNGRPQRAKHRNLLPKGFPVGGTLGFLSFLGMLHVVTVRVSYQVPKCSPTVDVSCDRGCA